MNAARVIANATTWSNETMPIGRVQPVNMTCAMTTKIIETIPLKLKADSKNALEERVAATTKGKSRWGEVPRRGA